jgi:hypothetical protein
MIRLWYLPSWVYKNLAGTQLQSDRLLRILVTFFASLFSLRLIVNVRAALITHAPRIQKISFELLNHFGSCYG